MYVYSLNNLSPMEQAMRRYVERNVRLGWWNHLFPVSQSDIYERATGQPYLTAALAFSPNDLLTRRTFGYIETVRRGRQVGGAFRTSGAFVEALDALYEAIGERPTYTLYSSFQAPSAAYLYQDDPSMRPRLRPAPVEDLIEQMTPGHVFLSRLALSEVSDKPVARLRREFTLKRALSEQSPREGAWRLSMAREMEAQRGGVTLSRSAVLRELSRRTGADPEELDKALRLGAAQGTADAPNTLIRTVAHEFAHATTQTPLRVSPRAMQDVLEGKRSLVDVVTRVALESQFLNEAQSDIFASAVSLNPDLTAESRYNMAAAAKVYTAAMNAKQELRGWKHGDPFRMVVINPEEVESPQGELAQRISRAVRRLLDKGGEQRLLSEMQEFVRDDGSVDREAFQRLHSRITGIAQGAAMIARAESKDASREIRQVLEHHGDRLWAIPYMIGKASPELVGKEIEITPEGVFLDGKKLDLAEVGLPDLELSSITGRQEMHPEQLERSMNALELYRRARRALRRGKRLVVQAGALATDVVRAWRREFGSI